MIMYRYLLLALRGQVKIEQNDLAAMLNWQATQEMRELDGYETLDSKGRIGRRRWMKRKG
jgi:hypothetical protein